MILMDSKGACIHAHVKRGLLVKFHPVLKEGNAYHIEKLMVGKNDPKFPTTSHKCKIKFMVSTSCSPLKECDIPMNHFEFKDFDLIKDLPDEGCLIDVIGHLVERGDLKSYEKAGKQISYMQFTLEDVSLKRLSCTFWGTYADELHGNLDTYNSSAPPVVLIQLCKTKSFRGVVGISNAFHGTRVFFNSDIPEINQYKLSMQHPSASLTPTITQVCAPPQLSLAEEILQCSRLTISDLIEACDVGVGVVLGRIVEIEVQHGWVYDSCNRCLRKVSKVGSRFYCKNKKCSRIVTAVPRDCNVGVNV